MRILPKDKPAELILRTLAAMACILGLGLLPVFSFAEEPKSARVIIEAGEFSMGDAYCAEEQGNSDWCNDEVPHKVRLGRYAIDRLEVTNEQFYECVAESKCNPNGLHQDRPKDFSYMQQPVTFVTWADADAYCRWKGARLPTEAEWERAAKAEDPGGAFFAQSYKSGAPEKVGQLRPNSLGLHDMMGNVYEWTADWMGPYSTDAVQVDPKGPETGKDKVVRGGSWNSPGHYLRASDRVGRSPEMQYSDVGFRCAQSMP